MSKQRRYFFIAVCKQKLQKTFALQRKIVFTLKLFNYSKLYTLNTKLKITPNNRFRARVPAADCDGTQVL